MINLNNLKRMTNRIEFLEKKEKCSSQVAIGWAILGGATFASSVFAITHDSTISAYMLLGVGIVSSVCAYIARNESNKANKELIEIDADLSKMLIKEVMINQNNLEK